MKNYDELKYYVMWHNFNDDIIEPFNIFRHYYVKNSIIKALKKYVTFESFKEELKNVFKYSYWSQSEYEVMISGLFDMNKTYKIDIWYQIEPNIDLIARYIIEIYNKGLRKKIEVNKK